MRLEGCIRGFCLLLIPFLFGIISGGRFPFLIFHICLMLVSVDLLWTLNSRKVMVRINTNCTTVHAGAQAGLYLEFNNPTPWPVPWVQCLVDLPETFAVDHNTGSYSLSLKSFESKALEDSFYCLFRGNYKWGAARVRTGGILGIFSLTTSVPKDLDLEVLPRFLYMGRDIAFRTGVHYSLRAGSGQALRRENGSADFFGIRAYNSADDKSLIHWKTSARMGSLYVKELRHTRKSDFIVYLDNGVNCSNEDPVDKQFETPVDKDFETDVTITASVLSTLIKGCHAAGLVVGGNINSDLRVAIGTGPMHFRTLLKQLAGVVPGKEGVLSEGLARAALGWPPGTGLIVVTRRLDENSAKFLERLQSGGVNCTVLLVSRAYGGQVSESVQTRAKVRSQCAVKVIRINQDQFCCFSRGA